MSTIIDALRREHVSIANVLGVLEREAAAFAQGKDMDFALLESAIDYFTEFSDRLHHPKEDLVFAELRRVDPARAQTVGDLAGSHAILSHDLHDFAAALVAVKDDEYQPRSQFVEQARAFIEHQRLHLAMEEAYFFPVADAELGPEVWAELENQMSDAADPLIGGPAGERFEALRQNIMSWEASRRPVPHA